MEEGKKPEQDRKLKRQKGAAGRFVKAAAALAFISGCAMFGRSLAADVEKPEAAPAAQAVSVVSHTVREKDLTALFEYIGRVEPQRSVDLKAQVEGTIVKEHVKEGAFIKKGQPVFTIDRSRYNAEVDLRSAEVKQAEANLDRAGKYCARLKAADKRSVSEADIEAAESSVLQGRAALSRAKAALRLARIDLEHTVISAPITGKVGRFVYTLGNYVTPASGTLATINGADPVRVVFPMADRDYLDRLDLYRRVGETAFKASLVLSNGAEYPLQGTRDYEDNEVDSKTGTISVRLKFSNPNGLLIPGSMVRLRIAPANPQKSVVVPQEAIMADSQGDYVYVIDGDNSAQIRRISLGKEFGAVREVRDGLKAGDRIVLRGVQALRPGTPVAEKTAVSPDKTAAGK